MEAFKAMTKETTHNVAHTASIPPRRYLSREEAAALPPVQEGLTAAGGQLARYRAALAAQYGDGLRLRTYAVVGLGFERLVWMEGATA